MKNILYQVFNVPLKNALRSINNTLWALFIFAGTAHATVSYSQNTNVTIVSTSISTEQIISEIENQTDYLFVYDVNEINLNRKININAKDKPVQNVLKQIFSGTDITYAIEGKNIMLIKKKKQVSTSKQKENTVTGIVKDSKGESIIGANIKVKGLTNGTITDIDGKFSLNIPENSILQISYIGYIAQEIKVGTKKNLTITLKEDTETLDEVIVIGYGTAKRENLSGAISTVNSEVFESRPIPNATLALQGEIPGVVVTRNSGTPGGDASIRIRDISSINGGQPLVLIDGAEGDLSTINPSDIENISVLKDGNAAIYGARAADGVILVTTKSGKRNQPLKVSFDAYYAIKKPALMKETVNLLQYAEMGLEITDGSWTPEYTKEDLDKIAANSPEVVPNGIWGMYPKFYQYVDTKKEVIGNGGQQYYNP
mgnify:FL=1